VEAGQVVLYLRGGATSELRTISTYSLVISATHAHLQQEYKAHEWHPHAREVSFSVKYPGRYPCAPLESLRGWLSWIDPPMINA
jgi:hypothetical protein